MEVRIDGRLHPGVTAKDIILAIIAQIGVGGGTGYVFEYTGEAIRALKRNGFEPRRTIELIIFTAEEPTRFGIGCLGSMAWSSSWSVPPWPRRS